MAAVRARSPGCERLDLAKTKMLNDEPRRKPRQMALGSLFCRLALAMRRLGVPRGLWMRLGSRGLFAPLPVISLAVMLSSHLTTLGGVLVTFGRFIVASWGMLILALQSSRGQSWFTW